MKTSFTFRLQAASFSDETEKELLAKNFVRERFMNNFHNRHMKYFLTCGIENEIGSPIRQSDIFWEEVTRLLEADRHFSGFMEERTHIPSAEYSRKESYTREINLLPVISPIKSGSYKPDSKRECDLVVFLPWQENREEIKNFLRALEMDSIDFPISQDNKVFNRMYSLKLEKIQDGIKVFRMLKAIAGRLPSFVGQVRLEKIERIFHRAENSVSSSPFSVSLVSHADYKEWIGSFPSYAKWQAI
jgi:hypothetical protein